MPPSNVRLRARRWQGYMDVMPHIRELQVSEALKSCSTILWVVESRYGISYLTEPERINVRSHFVGNFFLFFFQYCRTHQKKSLSIQLDHLRYLSPTNIRQTMVNMTATLEN